MSRYSANGDYISPCIESIVEIKEFKKSDYTWAGTKQYDFWFEELYRLIQQDDTHNHLLVNTEHCNKINTMGQSDYKRIILKAIEYSRDIKLKELLATNTTTTKDIKSPTLL